MALDARKKNAQWLLNVDANNKVSTDDAQLAVLMDIRDELQQINRMLGCHRIPKALDAVVAMHKQGVKRRVPRKRVRK